MGVIITLYEKILMFLFLLFYQIKI